MSEGLVCVLSDVNGCLTVKAQCSSVANPSTFFPAKCLIDSGATHSFVSQKLANLLAAEVV